MLWGQTGQAQKGAAFTKTAGIGEMKRHMPSTISAMQVWYQCWTHLSSEEDLVGAMIGHFPPAVQNGMVCGNFEKTHDALAILSKMQELETARLQHKSTTDPALQSVGMSFLSGNLIVLSGSRGTLYTTQHSRYYKLYYFTSYISLCSLTLQDYWIYIWMHL